MPAITERNRKWWTVVAMTLTTLLMTIDFNGITVALPTIGRDLDTSTTGLQCTINAYLLALAAPGGDRGRLADIFGRRRVVLIGTVVFIFGSMASGLAQADWWLIPARIVQGFGAAAFFAASWRTAGSPSSSRPRARTSTPPIARRYGGCSPAPPPPQKIERVTHEAFVHALDGAMLLSCSCR